MIKQRIVRALIVFAFCACILQTAICNKFSDNDKVVITVMLCNICNGICSGATGSVIDRNEVIDISTVDRIGFTTTLCVSPGYTIESDADQMEVTAEIPLKDATYLGNEPIVTKVVKDQGANLHIDAGEVLLLRNLENSISDVYVNGDAIKISESCRVVISEDSDLSLVSEQLSYVQAYLE